MSNTVAEPVREQSSAAPTRESDAAFTARQENAFPGATKETVLSRPEVAALYFNTSKGFNKEFHKLAYQERFDANTGESMDGVSPNDRVASRMLFNALRDLQKELGISPDATEADGIQLRQYTDSAKIDRAGRYARVVDMSRVVKKRITELQQSHPGVEIDKKFDEETGMRIPPDSLQYYLRLKYACDIADCDKGIKDSRSSPTWRLAKLAHQERRMSDGELLTLGQSLAETEARAQRAQQEAATIKAESAARLDAAQSEFEQQQAALALERQRREAEANAQVQALIQQVQAEAQEREAANRETLQREIAQLKKEWVNPHAARIKELEDDLKRLEEAQRAYQNSPLAV